MKNYVYTMWILKVFCGFLMVVHQCTFIGATVSTKDASALWDAVLEGTVEEVEAILAKYSGDDLKELADQKVLGVPLLYVLSGCSSIPIKTRVKMAKKLIEAGATVSSVDNLWEKTPLYTAIEFLDIPGNQQLVDLFSSHATPGDLTVSLFLLMRTKATDANKALVKKLILHGARVDVKNKEGLSPAQIAINNGNKEYLPILEGVASKNKRVLIGIAVGVLLVIGTFVAYKKRETLKKWWQQILYKLKLRRQKTGA